MQPFLEKRKDKIEASIIAGALGDALGAPIEGEKRFEILFEKYGDEGIQEFISAPSQFEDQLIEAGHTTDDTASIIGSMAAINLAGFDDKQKLLHHMWQANVIWASHQRGGEQIANFIDDKINWPTWFQSFFESRGAGRGTLGALSQGRMGTLENPIKVDGLINGKKISGLNAGCGGMMRIAPIGLMPSSREEILDISLRSTAITHGAPEAQAASSIIALTVHEVFNGVAINHAISKTLSFLEEYKIEGLDSCKKAFDVAAKAICFYAPASSIITKLPVKLECKNHFLAIPVLSQVIYGALAAHKIEQETGNKRIAFKKALSLSATIEGDSDSVASIIGNILGAAWGTASLDKDWLDGLNKLPELKCAISEFTNTVLEKKLEIK